MSELLVPDGYEPIEFYQKKVQEKIWADRNNVPYIEHGLISGSKLADATLVIILKMLKIDQTFDVYTLGKFMRGHEMEADLVELLTGIPKHEQLAQQWQTPTDTRVLQGKIMLQAEPIKGYRGMTNSVDLLEDIGTGYILHEIKSATKSAYDYVGAVGKGMYEYSYVNGKRQRSGRRQPEPKEHHCIQVASYALSQWDKPILGVALHYINADDYRMISFKIDPLKYKPEIDKEIDEVQFAFETKILPVHKPLYKWQSGKYNSFADWEKLNEQELLAKLKGDYPEAYDAFMNTRITDNGRE